MEHDLEKLLATAGLRITTPRKAVFRTLKAATYPLSQVEISATTPSVDKVSVYRTIELFLNLGVVVGVAHGWKQRYELAAPFRPHHHHMYCIKCGKVEEFQSKRLEKILHDLTRADDFQVLEHTFEVTGICRECRDI